LLHYVWVRDLCKFLLLLKFFVRVSYWVVIIAEFWFRVSCENSYCWIVYAGLMWVLLIAEDIMGLMWVYNLLNWVSCKSIYIAEFIMGSCKSIVIAEENFKCGLIIEFYIAEVKIWVSFECNVLLNFFEGLIWVLYIAELAWVSWVLYIAELAWVSCECNNCWNCYILGLIWV
jgi:hypothetical protein